MNKRYYYCPECNLAYNNKAKKEDGFPCSHNECLIDESVLPQPENVVQEVTYGVVSSLSRRNIPYRWDKTDRYNTGVLEDLYFGEEFILRKDAHNASHCCGLVLTVLIRVLNLLKEQGSEHVAALDPVRVKQAKDYLFGLMGKSHIGIGLESRGIGERVDPSQAGLGDYCQLLTEDGDIGHACLIIRPCLGWGRGVVNPAFIVFSSNSTTGGVGYDFYNAFSDRGFGIGRILA